MIINIGKLFWKGIISNQSEYLYIPKEQNKQDGTYIVSDYTNEKSFGKITIRKVGEINEFTDKFKIDSWEVN